MNINKHSLYADSHIIGVSVTMGKGKNYLHFTFWSDGDGAFPDGFVRWR